MCALIGKNNTIITNVGDSRAYILKDGKITQVTIDDSEAQEKLDEGRIPSKDAVRFYQHNNAITECVGVGFLNKIHTKVIENSEYDMLLLFSDGVTDYLSDDDIVLACKNTDRKVLARKLANKANETDLVMPEELYDEVEAYRLFEIAGKDNETVAIHILDEEDEER